MGRGLIFLTYYHNYEDAIDDFQKVIELDDSNVEAFCNTAQAYAQMGQLAKACEQLSKAIDVSDTPDAELYTSRGNMYCEMGKYEKALQDFKDALKIDNSADALKYVLEYFDIVGHHYSCV